MPKMTFIQPDGTRREVESLAATAEFQRFQVEAAYLTLTSNVVTAAVQEASVRGQIAATEEIIKIQTGSLDILRKQRVDVILTDLQMPVGGISGVDLLKATRSIAPETEVILMTAYGTVETAVEAMKE